MQPEELTSQVKVLQIQLSGYLKTISNYEIENASLRKEVQDLEAHIKTVEAENYRLEDCSEYWQEEAEQLKEKVKYLTYSNQELLKQIQALQKQG